MDWGTLDYTGLAALLTAGGHIAYTLYKGWKAKQLASIDEESEVITAQGDYLERLANSAATMIDTAEKRVTYLTEQLGILQVEYTTLRHKLIETQDIVAALKTENRRMQDRIRDLEDENKNLKARMQSLVAAMESNGHS